MATLNERQMERGVGSWSRTRWLAVRGLAAAVIVGIVLLAIAGALALLGKKRVDEAKPPKPERAIDSVQRDVDHVKERARR